MQNHGGRFLGISTIIICINATKFETLFIGIDIMQSKGYKKSHSTQNFIQMYQKYGKLLNYVYPLKPQFLSYKSGVRGGLDYTGFLT